MEEIEKDIVNGELDQLTLERQQDILTRLLKAENAERVRGEKERARVADSAGNPNRFPPSLEEYERRKAQEIELLRTVPADLTPYYKLRVNDYFNTLELPEQGVNSHHGRSEKMQIASRMEGITEVEGLINALCEEFGVEETHYGEILIAMTEAVNNAVVHGNKLDISKMVDIQVRTEGPVLEFRVAGSRSLASTSTTSPTRPLPKISRSRMAAGFS